jgi:hypothetical protein
MSQSAISRIWRAFGLNPTWSTASSSHRTWIELWNDDPNPFVLHKTADEILDNLANYCQRKTDSGH